jgi:hypothetical protein
MSDQQFLDALVGDPNIDSLPRTAQLLGLPLKCLLKCAATLLSCGPTNPECLAAFGACVLACRKNR